ncbi:hypothetical protein [Rhodobacter calidifons]|uniref:Excalibur calcium-binding domain-containing protein n=1 Tax=Rhodobacter calidifons TaxID=2715277 RepID=A0ABX0GCG3_9RHOB|nr:hypothetical protein [Rhodobacter calidifons]NHB78271.1 hypothetical protein [Rhodobacter calidifons]
MSRTFRPAAGATFAALILSACTPTTTDTGSGVGFQDYNSYIRGASAGPVGAPVVVPPPGGGFDPAAAAAAIDRAQGISPVTPVAPVAPVASAPVAPVAQAAPVVASSTATNSSARPRGGPPAGIKVESGEVASHTGISDEQDFSAVASRETIESDAERIARNRAEYVVVQPKDLPTRPGDTGPNIVEFALATKHAPGVQMYRRSGLGVRDSNAACAKYASSDKAQQDFLAKGGPERDRMGLDPDGDGFACAWDPRPFRTALQ